MVRNITLAEGRGRAPRCLPRRLKSTDWLTIHNDSVRVIGKSAQ
jgi:hypothetical protein